MIPIENSKAAGVPSSSRSLNKVEVELSPKDKDSASNPKAVALNHFDPAPSQATPPPSFYPGPLWNKPGIAGDGDKDADQKAKTGAADALQNKVSNPPNASDSDPVDPVGEEASAPQIRHGLESSKDNEGSTEPEAAQGKVALDSNVSVLKKTAFSNISEESLKARSLEHSAVEIPPHILEILSGAGYRNLYDLRGVTDGQFLALEGFNPEMLGQLQKEVYSAMIFWSLGRQIRSRANRLRQSKGIGDVKPVDVLSREWGKTQKRVSLDFDISLRTGSNDMNSHGIRPFASAIPGQFQVILLESANKTNSPEAFAEALLVALKVASSQEKLPRSLRLLERKLNELGSNFQNSNDSIHVQRAAYKILIVFALEEENLNLTERESGILKTHLTLDEAERKILQGYQERHQEISRRLKKRGLRGLRLDEIEATSFLESIKTAQLEIQANQPLTPKQFQDIFLKAAKETTSPEILAESLLATLEFIASQIELPPRLLMLQRKLNELGNNFQNSNASLHIQRSAYKILLVVALQEELQHFKDEEFETLQKHLTLNEIEQRIFEAYRVSLQIEKNGSPKDLRLADLEVISFLNSIKTAVDPKRGAIEQRDAAKRHDKETRDPKGKKRPKGK